MPRNRNFPPHLELRCSSFFWRRRLPRSRKDRCNSRSVEAEKKICTPSKKSSLCFSLRTHVLRDAKILARRLTEMSDLVFAAEAEMTMEMTLETKAWILESLVRFEIEAFERARATAAPRSSELAAMDLRREEVLQHTLRQALYCGNREVARNPLRHVAGQLGITLDEDDKDWVTLAYDATKVLLDISQERARRQQGVYEQPTVFFRRAVSAPASGLAAQVSTQPASSIAPATFAASNPTPIVMPAVSVTEEQAQATAPQSAAPAAPQEQASSPASSEPAPLHEMASAKARGPLANSTFLTPIIIPAGLEQPANCDETRWQQARIIARPPRILVDKSLLSKGSREALKKQRGITLVEAIELYFEVLSWGYKAPFSKQQKRKKKILEQDRNVTLEERLCEDHRNKYRLARGFWPSVIGDVPVDEICFEDVNDALERFWAVPANHARSSKDRAKYSLIERIEKAVAAEAQLEKDIQAAEARGAGAEEIDKMRLKGHKPRITVATYVKHGRVLRAIGEMLWDMQLIDNDPFAICTWSNDEEVALKKSEGQRKREAWDDRIYHLWGSRIYQEHLEDVGDPLFWAPLIARHQGMRMEEILQLGPDDFGTDKGIPYLRIQNTIINGVKTLSSERTLPIHPQLIELGLLKLVALRKKQDRIRLFPFLNRGKQKGTFSANFSKNFGYYRRTNECYWPGLDFHALRTTFHHDLLGDDKSDAIRCRLMGHTYTDEGDRHYGQNLGIEKLAERMKSVVVDISMIRRPFDTLRAGAETPAQGSHLRIVV
ncbi:hypothetical protein K3759_12125 [Sulfitobacter sp. W027]|uniref:hypothetical protein n=1 Tax=Sulfitobacter sp. W027 TaxID=2867025 RepID=UPI0021A517F3|nr:hypothetical protein [Sulfitobacter sp. W027]UWR32688.1 hypothetical protein K3759_12125 [Sulfitobacter sp. W027]